MNRGKFFDLASCDRFLTEAVAALTIAQKFQQPAVARLLLEEYMSVNDLKQVQLFVTPDRIGPPNIEVNKAKKDEVLRFMPAEINFKDLFDDDDDDNEGTKTMSSAEKSQLQSVTAPSQLCHMIDTRKEIPYPLLEKLTVENSNIILYRGLISVTPVTLEAYGSFFFSFVFTTERSPEVCFI